MKGSKYKPVGWRNEPHRHSLAAKGIKTKYLAEKQAPAVMDIRKVGGPKKGRPFGISRVKTKFVEPETSGDGVDVELYDDERGDDPVLDVELYDDESGMENVIDTKVTVPTPPPPRKEDVEQLREGYREGLRRRGQEIKAAGRATGEAAQKYAIDPVRKEFPAPGKEDVEQLKEGYKEGLRRRGQELKKVADPREVRDEIRDLDEQLRAGAREKKAQKEVLQQEQERLQEIKETEEELNKKLERRGIGFKFNEQEEPSRLQKLKEAAKEKWLEHKRLQEADTQEEKTRLREKFAREQGQAKIEQVKDEQAERLQRIRKMKQKLGRERMQEVPVRRDRIGRGTT